MFQYVQAYLGVTEPQMRKTEHMHMLVHLLGFSHPEDFFRAGAFVERFRRVWAFCASISIQSQEGFARHCGTSAGMDALRGLPLVPLTAKQRKMLGSARVQEQIDAQLQARGVEASPEETAEDFKSYVHWPAAAHRSATLSAEAWEAQAVRDVYRGTRKCGNHVCLPAVCHKNTRIGKLGFCRLLFWHWRAQVNEQQKLVMKRVHGRELVQAWDGSGLPPVSALPPHVGAPAQERTHAFHFKMNPTIMLGPGCNHDVGLLVRVPVLTSEQQAALTENDCSSGDAFVQSPEFTRMMEATMETQVDHEFYSVAYASKEQDQSEGLFRSLYDAKRKA